MKSENAAQYIPPEKRKYIKEYLSNSSIKFQTSGDGGDRREKFSTSNQAMMSLPHGSQSPEEIKN